MSKILLVDDDPLVLQMYQDGLQQLGAEVTTASDGIDAIQALRGARPDVLVLDLMMPKFTGADVLKFVRSEPALKNLPVVVLSNSYMNQLAGEAVALGVEKALLKIRCSPSVLLDAINEAADGQPRNRDASVLLAVPAPTPTAPPTPAGQPEPPAAAPAPGASAAPLTAAEFDAKAREVLVRNARETCTTLRNLYQAYTSAPNPAEREQRLQTLTRKVHFVAATAGLAKCRRLGQVASALEALLFELQARPAGADPSVGRTIAGAVDFLALLFDYARDADPDAPSSSQALVVDDDPLSNRLVVSALNRAQVQARSTVDPKDGLQRLQKEQFDLVLLDIEMPGMDGFELCRRLRQLPGYAKTPVIYVTIHSDFEHRAKSILSGGDDLVAKPVFPMDLAVKAIVLLLKRQLAQAQPQKS